MSGYHDKSGVELVLALCSLEPARVQTVYDTLTNPSQVTRDVIKSSHRHERWAYIYFRDDLTAEDNAELARLDT